MEKELYYYLSDNADIGVYLKTLREVMDVIEADFGDIQPSDREDVEYTIKPVYMTEYEFNELPEWEG